MGHKGHMAQMNQIRRGGIYHPDEIRKFVCVPDFEKISSAPDEKNPGHDSDLCVVNQVLNDSISQITRLKNYRFMIPIENKPTPGGKQNS